MPFDVIATLGPASLDRVGALADAGATGFRLNASHLGVAGTLDALAEVERADTGLPVVVDLQGAKMRLGQVAARRVALGQSLTFALADHADAIPLPHRELFHAARPGMTLAIDDGRLRLRVERIEGERLVAEVTRAGTLASRKGVNLAEHPVELDGLSAADAELVRGAGARSDWAFSFMRDGREAAWLRALGARRVVGKVERAEAVTSLAMLAARVDTMWICRGDLGVQLGLVELARFVAELTPPRLPCPVLMAGQVLEHLTRHPEPTRSEVCHLYDLVRRGYAGVVLSDETAIGDEPVAAVRVAVALGAAAAGAPAAPSPPDA